MSLCSPFVLLMLVAAALADSVSKCSEMDVTGLKDTLRQSACTLTQGGNATAAEAFKDYVQSKHGEHNQQPYFTFAELFHLSTTNVWCRSTCDNPAPENITWCINIAYRDRDVETCIRPGTYQPIIINSTCEAELVGVPSFLSLPSDCEYYGDVGCLGLTNLDWFFQGAYLTCTVEIDNCYSKSFTELLTYAGVSQHPEFEVFPTAPINILFSDQLVLHAELTTTTDRITAFWEHDGIKYTSFIFEDPFCNKEFEECRNDTHPDAPALKQERIRAYRTTRVIRLDGCETTLIYRLESYLIIDNTVADDSGQYSFNLTATHAGYTPANVARSVNATISCDFEPEAAVCSSTSFSIAKNDTSKLQCIMTASPYSNFSLHINKTTIIKPNEKDYVNCGYKSEVIFSVAEEQQHFCYSQYNFTIIICAADENVVGNFYVVNDDTGHLATGTVEVKLIQEPTIVNEGSDSSSGSYKAVVYAVPLAVLIVTLLTIIVILILVLRSRKRRRDRRIITHLHSPSLKEAAFFKEEGLHSPVSPGNSSFGDHLEFPRNRLYIYSNKVLGEGSFGRVLQAKAEGIVPGMPNRNIVAIKTTKDNATSIEREELMAELELMKSMNPHENILNLLGYCTSPGGPLCLIVEYATYGNLRDFLRQCEEVVLSLNHMPHIPRNRSRTRTFSASSCGSSQPLLSRQDSVFTPSNGHTHFIFPSPPTSHVSTGSTGSGDMKLTAHHPDATALPLAHSVAPIGHDYINTKGLVYMEDVHNFALQVACGLQHLATMQIVHCDLAARNVLIAEGFVLKIADFGLARDISGQELYKKNPRGKIPVKWTAPEALENRVFTVKSDVWSYGVLLWELFTYGHTPYPEVNLGPSYEGFILYLKDGNRMQQPDSCPASFYELMRECWHLDPSHRPNPHDIVVQLTPSESIFDDADSEINDGQFVSSKITSNNSAGHQSSQE